MAYEYWDDDYGDFDDDPRYPSIATRHHALIREAEMRADRSKIVQHLRELRDAAAWRRLAGSNRRQPAGRADAIWHARKALKTAVMIRTFIGPDLPEEEIPF